MIAEFVNCLSEFVNILSECKTVFKFVSYSESYHNLCPENALLIYQMVHHLLAQSSFMVSLHEICASGCHLLHTYCMLSDDVCDCG